MIQELTSDCGRFVRATMVGNARVLTMLEEHGQCFTTRVYVIGLKRVYHTCDRDKAEENHRLIILLLVEGGELPESHAA